MHRRLRLFLVLTIALAALQLASLWNISWLSRGKGVQAFVGQGVVRLWIGSPGDFAAQPSGLKLGGWTGDALIWRPEIKRQSRLWVVMPNGPAKAVFGSLVELPVLYVLSLSAGLTARSWLARRRLRRLPSQCRECGYDLRGIPHGPCPECGAIRSALRRLIRLIASRPSPAARSASL